MSSEKRTTVPVLRKRYDAFLDASGSWTIDIREYQSDLNSIAPVDVPPDPSPEEAYRTAVFLEGFIQEQKSVANWSDSALDQFDSFESTVEFEAVAKALRHIGNHTE